MKTHPESGKKMNTFDETETEWELSTLNKGARVADGMRREGFLSFWFSRQLIGRKKQEEVCIYGWGGRDD